jgi:hypothetical protein
LTLTVTCCPSWRLVRGVTVTRSAIRRIDGLAVVEVGGWLAAGDEDPPPHPVATKAKESKDPTTPTDNLLILAKLSTRHPAEHRCPLSPNTRMNHLASQCFLSSAGIVAG